MENPHQQTIFPLSAFVFHWGITTSAMMFNVFPPQRSCKITVVSPGITGWNSLLWGVQEIIFYKHSSPLWSQMCMQTFALCCDVPHTPWGQSCTAQSCRVWDLLVPDISQAGALLAFPKIHLKFLKLQHFCGCFTPETGVWSLGLWDCTCTMNWGL